MRIVRFEATNLKKLRAVAITPDGNVVRITGANGSGKSSVLDGIFWALSGKKSMTSKPVRDGEQSATVTLALGNITVTRKFSGEGDTSLIVESAEGARFPSPQKMLDALFGELTFDPAAFSRAEPKAQLETLRGMVHLDVDIDAIDKATEKDYVLRTDWNRRTRSLKEKAAALEGNVDSAMDTTLIDTGAIMEQMNAAQQANAVRDREELRRAQRWAQRSTLIDKKEEARAKIERLKAIVLECETAIVEIESERERAGELPAPVDLSEFRAQFNAAQKTNVEREQQERHREDHRRAVDELQAATLESELLTKNIDERTQRRAAAIAAAQMPVPGLSFGAGEVLYNGIPFSQASTAEQIRVSMAIAMQTNPKLRIVLIRDGSLLDEHSLAIVEQMAEEHDFQVWLEAVDTSGKVGIVLEDGMVTAIDGVSVERVAEVVAL